MDKRTFLRTFGVGTASLAISCKVRALPQSASVGVITPLVADKLKPGDFIGFVSPSSALVDPTIVSKAKDCFEQMGFRTKWGDHILGRHGHLAGTDEERLADIHRMFADKEVKAIVCMRGGSGAARLLDKLDYDLIRRNPKVFLGYSDITAYLQAIYTQTGLITFHGPVATSDWTAPILAQFERLFVRGDLPIYSSSPISEDGLLHDYEPLSTITPGVAEGRLLGGNLTVLTGIAGSSYFPDFEDSILFLEDVGEKPYRVDRMMSQLELTGVLRKIKGFIFGQCTDCSDNPDRSLTLPQIFDHFIKPLGVPAFQGAMIGHINEQFILPVGARVRMDAGNGSFSLVEQVVK